MSGLTIGRVAFFVCLVSLTAWSWQRMAARQRARDAVAWRRCAP